MRLLKGGASMAKFFNPDISQLVQCMTQAKLFRLAWEKGYRMEEFIPAFMNSRAAEGLDADYDRMQWAGEAYILNSVVREHRLFPEIKPGPQNPEALYWAGYIYRYWHYLTGESSVEIFKTAGYPYILEVYAGYHTFVNQELAVMKMKERVVAA